MSEQDKATAGSRHKRQRPDEEKLAGHWLMSFLKNRRRETAAAIILLMLAVAVYDSGDTTEETTSDGALGNIEDLLGGFGTDSGTPAQPDRLADSDNGGLTIPQHDDSELMDPFQALSIPAAGATDDESTEYGQPESITAFSNDPIQITPASSSRSAEQPDPMNFESEFPFADQTEQPQPASRTHVRLTGTIEALK